MAATSRRRPRALLRETRETQRRSTMAIPRKIKASPQALRSQADAEKAFQIYLDMGPKRSLARLQRLLTMDHPKLARSVPAIEMWSRKYEWQKRIEAHEDGLRAGMRQARRDARAPAQEQPESEEFDPIATLVAA